MDPTLYTFVLPTTVNGMTHVAVLGEQRKASSINVTGEYGKIVNSVFQSGVMMVPFQADIAGEHLIDLGEQSKAAGRPPTKPRHSMDSTDVALWLEEDPTVIETRIAARIAAAGAP